MDRDTVFSYLGGCFSGEPASCAYACPFRLDLRSFLKKAGRGRWDAAYKELRLASPFPTVTAALCPAPCGEACQLSAVLGGDAIRVRDVERACIAYAKRKESVVYAIPPKEERIAVVGADPAGLCCALMLAQKRYPVTIFDKNEGWGGSLRDMDDFPVFDEDIGFQFSSVTAEFKFNTEITDPEQLAGFAAVFVATGEGGLELRSGGDSRIFTGGALTGLSLTEGMADAMRAASSIEAYLQTGSGEYSAEPWDRKNVCRFAPHDGETATRAVVPSGEYTREEAQAEAARCMQCDCSACMSSCELLETYKKKPPRIASDVSQDGQSRNSVSSAAITRETWSCNLCGRCADRCSAGADIEGLFHLSRADRVAGGNYPPALHAYWLRELELASGDAALAVRGSGDTAFFPGCRLGASSPEYVKNAYGLLREQLGSGLLLNCCGVPAYWAGEDRLFESHISALRRAWQELGSPRLIVACPTCDKMLGKFLPEIPRRSLYAALAELKLPEAAGGAARAAVFDPCAARGDDTVKSAVRKLAGQAGIEVTAFDNGGKCCGYGGHMQLANPKLYGAIVENRAGEAEEPYIVYCANCRETLMAAGKQCRHILDVIFGTDTPLSTLEEKRENLLRLKAELSGGGFTPEKQPWDGVSVTLSPELRQTMERSLIPLGDVRRLIWQTEAERGGFEDENGDILARLKTGTVTVWAKYRASGDGYELLDAYSIRMDVREDL